MMCQCVCPRGLVNQVDASLYLFFFPFMLFMLFVLFIYFIEPLSHVLHQIRPPTAAGVSFDLIGQEEVPASLRARLSSPSLSTLIRADRFTIPQQGKNKSPIGMCNLRLSEKKKRKKNHCVSVDCMSRLFDASRVGSSQRIDRNTSSSGVLCRSPRGIFNLLSWRPEVNQQKRLLMTLT